jgi:hypothetical protein
VGENDMLDNIKGTCHYVVNNSKYVKINYDKLDEFINEINCKNLKNWLLFNPYNLLELDIEIIINFLLIFESIDYSFWGMPKWTIDTEEGLKDGSDALLYAMIKYLKETGNTDFSNITFYEFKELLKGNVDIPLIEERYKTIVNISRVVNEKMNGSFYNYIKDINIDKELFDIIINNFDSFKDERQYKGKTIYFYKLAQLLTSDILHIREKFENISVDYSNLTGCADYKIPQTLRALGIIEYNNELSKTVDQGIELEISSEFEVEIRASQMVVIDYISNRLIDTKPIDINDYLFIYSKKVKNISKPYHLCRNTNY